MITKPSRAKLLLLLALRISTIFYENLETEQKQRWQANLVLLLHPGGVCIIINHPHQKS